MALSTLDDRAEKNIPSPSPATPAATSSIRLTGHQFVGPTPMTSIRVPCSSTISARNTPPATALASHSGRRSIGSASRKPCVLASCSPASSIEPHTSPYVHASTTATSPSDSRSDCSVRTLSGRTNIGTATSTPALSTASASQIERCSRYSFHRMEAIMTGPLSGRSAPP